MKKSIAWIQERKLFHAYVQDENGQAEQEFV